MNSNDQILFTIKNKILEIVPGAEVILFGSRASNTASEESDWDLLVLSSREPITNDIKLRVHNNIFPISVSIGSFINVMLVTKSDWQHSPSYYALQKTVALNCKSL